jgi:hypothetical protein
MPPAARGAATAGVVAGMVVETGVGAVPEAWGEAKRSERKAATAGACW